MGLSDTLINTVFGTNIHTIKVSAEQLAAIINDAFIMKATNREELDKIERTVRGSKLIFRRMDSEDGKFHLYVSYFERGLTQHRFVFVKNYETEEVFEWRGLNLSPLKRAVEPYLLHARMHPTTTIPPFMSSDFAEYSDTNSNDSFPDEEYTTPPNQTLEITENEPDKEEPIIINPSATADSLIKRASSFLENNEWKKADAYCEHALDLEPENAKAYLVKLMIERNVNDLDSLSNQTVPLENSINYKKALQYADSEFASTLQSYNQEIKCGPVYAEATHLLGVANSTSTVEKAQKLFQSISEYKDVPQKLKQCQTKLDLFKEQDYNAALKLMNSADTSNQFNEAGKKFQQLSNYKDSEERYKQCLLRADEIEKEIKYQRAIACKSRDTIHELQLAKNILIELGDWKDSNTLVQEIDARTEELQQQLEYMRQQQMKEERLVIPAIIISIIVIIVIIIIYG